MKFTETDKLKALAIVNIFETSRPFGDYTACVVLNDGAGVSYGIGQFTHRSGSLLDVVERYLNNGGLVGAATLSTNLTALRDRSAASIARVAADGKFRMALRSAGVTREMKEAQMFTATARYLLPAIRECQRYGYREPLTLAAIYDSMIHGSYFRVARTVIADRYDERAWITAYVRRRDHWLLSIPRLAATRYRTRFFLMQIAISNWRLRLPFDVHGVRLDEGTFEQMTAAAEKPEAASVNQRIGAAVESAAEKYDRVESVVRTAIARKDAAKSLWTTVLGTVWQTAWAAFAFIAGLPREFWITAAVIAGVLMLAYLYRQIALGKIREHLATNQQTI